MAETNNASEVVGGVNTLKGLLYAERQVQISKEALVARFLFAIVGECSGFDEVGCKIVEKDEFVKITVVMDDATIFSVISSGRIGSYRVEHDGGRKCLAFNIAKVAFEGVIGTQKPTQEEGLARFMVGVQSGEIGGRVEEVVSGGEKPAGNNPFDPFDDSFDVGHPTS